MFIWFRDAKSLVRAVDYIATRKIIRESVEALFAEAFISVYGEFFHCDMQDLEQLTPDQFDFFNKLRDESVRDMNDWKRPRIGYREVELAKELLKIRRGDESTGFMFLYWHMAFFFHRTAVSQDPKTMNALALTLAGLPDHKIYELADKVLQKDRTFFDPGFRQLIRRAESDRPQDVISGVNPSYLFGAFAEVPYAERVVFNYLIARQTLEDYNIDDLNDVQSALFSIIKGKAPLGYKIVQDDEERIESKYTGKYG